MKNTLGFIKFRKNRYKLFLASCENVVLNNFILTLTYANGTSVSIDIRTNPIEYPKIWSRASYDGWFDEIVESIDVPKNIIKVALYYPTEDFSWLYNISAHRLKKLEFGVGCNFNDRIPIDFLKKWAEKKCLSVHPRCCWEHPRIFKEAYDNNSFNRMLLMGNNSPYLHLYRSIRGDSRPEMDLKSFGKTGIIKPSFTKLLENTDDHFVLNLPQHILEQVVINAKWSDKLKLNKTTPLTFGDLSTLGISPKVLLPQFTKNEAKKLVKKLWDKYYNKYIDNRYYLEEFCPNIPAGWYRDFSLTTSKTVMLWVNSHVNQLSKTRLIYGPAGSVATFHYHLLIKELTDDILEKGVSTGWKAVLKRLEDLQIQKMKTNLGEDVQFPKLKHPRLQECKRVESSWALVEEGNSMHHCVGGPAYTQACIAKKSFIFHVGNAAPEGATLEIGKNNGTWKIHQIFAYGNSMANEKEENIAKNLIATLNKNKISL